MMADIAAALAKAARTLEATSDTPRLDAELLMAHALEIERGDMLLRQRDLEVPATFDALITRRMAHEPVAYIIGHQDFWNLRLGVSPDVLIPRADSETLIEAAMAHFADRSAKRILDLGTGSGALLLAALSCFADAKGVGVDASGNALAVARHNAAQLGFADRCALIEASWHSAGWSSPLGTFDLILCNPPYVETTAALAPQVTHYEPHAALFAGEDGLSDYRGLIPKIPALLAPGGVAIFEIGQGQSSAVSELAVSAGLSTSQRNDLAGIVRAISMTA